MTELKFKLDKKRLNKINVSNSRILINGTPENLSIRSGDKSSTALHFSDVSGFSSQIGLGVNKDLEKTLRKFVIAFIKEQPNDMIDYAVSHFTEIQQQRNRRARKKSQQSETSQDDSDITSISKDVEAIKNLGDDDGGSSHRISVCSETFDSSASFQSGDLRVILPKSDSQRFRLLNSIQPCFMFRDLEVEEMHNVADAMYELLVQPGEVLITEGAEGDNFYVIESGKYNVFQDGKQVITRTDGSFGEMALLYSAPRNATIIAETAGRLWVLDRETFRNLLRKHAFKKQERYQEMVNHSPLLGNLPKYNRVQVLVHLEPIEFKKGAAITNCGENVGGMYFIEEGRCSVRAVPPSGNEAEEALVVYKSMGDYFGEVELILNIKQFASIRAETDVKLGLLKPQYFKQFLGVAMDSMLNTIEQEYKLKDDYVIDRLKHFLQNREYVKTQ